MLRHCEAQGNAARGGDVDALEAHTDAITALTDRVASAERARHEVLRTIVKAYALPPERQTLTELVAETPAPWSERLAAFQQAMQDTLRETRRVVRQNAWAIRTGLRTVNHALALVEPRTPGDDVYSRQGDTGMRRVRQPSLIDARG